MTKAYILEEEEYEELLKKKNECDITLRETNKNLKLKIDSLEKQADKAKLITGIPMNRNLGPLKSSENGEALTFTTWLDFVSFLNAVSEQNKCTNWKSLDQAILDTSITLVSWFNVEPMFSSTIEVKRYRLAVAKRNNLTSYKRDKCLYYSITKKDT